jgi:calcineurin-like phosphoesterase family protein
MTVWYTSDHHIGHPFVASLRWHQINGTPAEKAAFDMGSTLPTGPIYTAWHDEFLADRWDSVVKPDDTVYVLGDTSVGKTRVEDAMRWFSDRPGIKHLIWGNHDEGHPMHTKSHTWQPIYRTAFSTTDSIGSRRIPFGDKNTPYRTVMLSHFPYEGDHYDEDRFDHFRLKDHGVPILHGHTHSGQRFSTTTTGTRQIHVGVDAWDFYPVHQDAIAEYLK